MLCDGFGERQILFHNVITGGDHLTRVEHAGQIFARLGRIHKITGAPDQRASKEERTAP